MSREMTWILLLYSSIKLPTAMVKASWLDTPTEYTGQGAAQV